jgi:bacterioferritin B
MLISTALTMALNEQIGHEFGASLQYVAMAAYFDRENLPVFARHFFRQADEERDHAMRIVHFVLDAGGHVAIPAIPAGTQTFSSVEEAVRLALEWELTVTQQINGLVDHAIRENNHLAKTFLDWFVTEQLEEVASMERLLGMVRRAGESGLLLVEHYLANTSSADPNASAGDA